MRRKGRETVRDTSNVSGSANKRKSTGGDTTRHFQRSPLHHGRLFDLRHAARSGTDESGELSKWEKQQRWTIILPWVRSVTHAIHSISRRSLCSLKKEDGVRERASERAREENEVIVRFNLDNMSVNGQTARLNSKNLVFGVGLGRVCWSCAGLSSHCPHLRRDHSSILACVVSSVTQATRALKITSDSM